MKENMELLILGLLKNFGPAHGYVIKKEIEERINPLVNLNLTSIYYTLDKLAEKGFLAVENTKGERGRSRRVYSITEKGKRRFVILLMKNILQVERPYFNIDLALMFLDEMPDGRRAKRLIKKRIASLEKILLWIEQNLTEKELPPHKELILEHLKRELEEEISFTKDLLNLVMREKFARKKFSRVHDT